MAEVDLRLPQYDRSFTFAHEFGHVLNAVHSQSVQQSVSPYNQTLMAESNTSSRVLYYSNPDVYFPAGSPPQQTGSSSNNNAARIAGAAPSVAAKRSYIAPSGGKYTPLEVPDRVLDTRSFEYGGLTSLGTAAQQVAVLAENVPAGAKAVAINVVVVSSTNDDGGLKVTPSQTSAQSTSTQPSMLFKANDARSQTIVVNLGTYRTIWMATTSDTVDVIADVVGFFGSTGSYMHALNESTRVIDESFSAGQTKTINVSSVCPGTSSAAFVNIVAVLPINAGHLVARGYSNGYNASYSTLNYSSGDVIANATFVELDSQRFNIYSHAQVTRVIVDVFGCLVPSSSPITGSGGGKTFTGYATPIQRANVTLNNTTGTTYVTVGGGSGSTALTSANVTANTAAAHLWAYKPTSPLPSTSNINLVPGDGISNTMVTPTSPVSGSDRFKIKRNTNTSGSTTVQVIQLGYFS